MSKQEATTIILSGTESDRFAETAYAFARSRNQLVSFLYAEQKGAKWFQDRLKKYPGLQIMVDSGAHSFRSEGYCEKWPDLQWFDDYALRYRDWILKHKEYINLVVNLDVDAPCGMSNMLRWDNDVFRPMEREGVPVCYVWHQNYGFDFWLKMCREHEYVGLPGNLPEGEWHKYMKPAIMNGCRVHGFAATKSYILGKVPIATADSISWKSGEMYGQTFVFEGCKLRTYDKTQKDARAKYKAKWVAMGVDWDLLEQDQASEITKVCAIAWGDYQEHVTNMTKKLAYWNKTSAVVDEFLAANSGVNAITKEAAEAFFVKLKAPIKADSEAQVRRDLKELRAFLARDGVVVFALDDERITYWLTLLGAEPESDTRVEKEAAIRQALYKWFYKLQATEALPRLTADTVTPSTEPAERDEPLRPYAVVDADLPLSPGAALVEAEALDGNSISMPLLIETTKVNQTEEGAQPVDSTAQPDDQGTQAVVEEVRKPLPDKGFTEEITDTLLRARAAYGVDLLFEQNKLKHEATQLKILRREPKRQRTLSQKAAAIAVEVTKIVEEAGPAVAAKMQAAAEGAFDAWLVASNPDLQKALAEKAKRLPAQAQRLAADPAIAREIGRLGGAPKGNQNARKHGLYSPRLPQLACDGCPHIQVCPQYRAGHVCAFLNEFATWGSDKQNKELAFLEDLLQSQVVRLRRAMLFETFEGGITNKEVSKLSRDVATLTKLISEIRNPVQRGFGPAAAAPSAGEKKPSILGELFKDLKKGPDGAFAAQVPEKPHAAQG